jgi:hypothetical protein
MLKTVLFLASALPAALLADTVFLSGSFVQDDSIEWLRISVNSPATVTINTLSFAGGINYLSDSISAGGFAPVLSLFAESGLQPLLATDHDGGPGPGCGPRASDPASGFCWDGYMSTALPSGSYLLALTEDDNLAFGPTLADGFSRTGQGNFTGPNFTGQSGSFILVTGAQRTSDWDLQIDGATTVAAVATPELGSMYVFLSGALLIGFGRKSRSSHV